MGLQPCYANLVNEIAICLSHCARLINLANEIKIEISLLQNKNLRILSTSVYWFVYSFYSFSDVVKT